MDYRARSWENSEEDASYTSTMVSDALDRQLLDNPPSNSWELTAVLSYRQRCAQRGQAYCTPQRSAPEQREASGSSASESELCWKEGAWFVDCFGHNTAVASHTTGGSNAELPIPSLLHDVSIDWVALEQVW